MNNNLWNHHLVNETAFTPCEKMPADVSSGYEDRPWTHIKLHSSQMYHEIA